MSAKLTPTAQGFHDLYWCKYGDKPVIVTASTCPDCGVAVSTNERTHQFLAHIHRGDDIQNEVIALAEVVKGTDDAEAEIEILRDAISGFGQQVHQAYHGAQAPDLCDVNHLECPRGLCRSIQHVLNPKRPRGMP